MRLHSWKMNTAKRHFVSKFYQREVLLPRICGAIASVCLSTGRPKQLSFRYLELGRIDDIHKIKEPMQNETMRYGLDLNGTVRIDRSLDSKYF
mmetsp:Transcript_17424/g.36426  ORF Transcript_17424/g.36426 Transcript_17424/m.36426 type:complete len:93 (+) Transcript_17424:1182-1460(+)